MTHYVTDIIAYNSDIIATRFADAASANWGLLILLRKSTFCLADLADLEIT